MSQARIDQREVLRLLNQHPRKFHSLRIKLELEEKPADLIPLRQLLRRMQRERLITENGGLLSVAPDGQKLLRQESKKFPCSDKYRESRDN